MLQFDMLKLDFGREQVIYEGKTYPTGAIAVSALNIDQAMLEQMELSCNALKSFRSAFNRGKVTDPLLVSARQAALRILSQMAEMEPFAHYKDAPLKKMVDETYTKANVTLATSLARVESNITGLTSQQHNALKMIRLTDVLSNFADAVRILQKHIAPFAEDMMDESCSRTIAGFAYAVRDHFDETITFEEGDCSWTALINVTMQYKTALPEGAKVPVIVTSMDFVSLGGLFRADFFEGLRVGHAPKRCANCGRWFLTTNARPTKYCSEVNLTDPYHRTCRQLASQLGAEARECAADHPYRILKERVRKSIDKRLSRGTLTPELGARMKHLAKGKMERALADPQYAHQRYEAEMTIDALYAEASA